MDDKQKGEEDAKPSSLIAVRKLSVPDPPYELQLLRAVKIANERAVREFGPASPRGLSVRLKREPKPWPENKTSSVISKQDEDMRIKQMAALAASATITCNAVAFETSSAVPSHPTIVSDSTSSNQAADIFVRTEQFPRPPYSEATYYIYEQAGKTICTKIEVCNKYGNCESQYKKGVFKAPEDQETGAPYGMTSPVLIPKEKLSKHVCLGKFNLVD
jgi:hypothetical protein